MKPVRLFVYDRYKGERNYLRIQAKYEVARTVLYFGVSLVLFFAGIAATKTRLNLLTLIAVLGMLPASKSAIDAFMFLRYKGCPEETAAQIEAHIADSRGIYDRVFTSYEKNFCVDHMVVKGNTVCGYSKDAAFDEVAFRQHISSILKKDGFSETHVKIFQNLDKYLNRLDEIRQLETDVKNTEKIIETLNSVSL